MMAVTVRIKVSGIGTCWLECDVCGPVRDRERILFVFRDKAQAKLGQRAHKQAHR
jgi:hypothetical protein